MRWAAFTIVYPPTIEWFGRNLRRLGKLFDKWYVVYAWTTDQRKAVKKHLHRSHTDFDEHYCRDIEWLEGLASKHIPGVEVLFPPADLPIRKEDMCDLALRCAREDQVDILWQLDADEWMDAADAHEMIVEFDDYVRACEHGLIGEPRIDEITNVREIKYWKNFIPLTQKEWQSSPARIFDIRRASGFSSHRPPGLILEDGTRSLYDPNKVSAFYKHSGLREPIVDHFCYVDPVQVMLKSAYFATIRPDVPGYRDYFKWFQTQYSIWDSIRQYSPFCYHPTHNESILKESSRFDLLQRKYKDDAEFLRGYYEKQ